MIRFLNKKLRGLSLLGNSNISNGSANKNQPPSVLSSDLQANLDMLKKTLGESQDVVVREFSFGQHARVDVALIFLDGLVNKTMINDNIIKPLMYDTHLIRPGEDKSMDNIDYIKKALLAVSDVKGKTALNEMIASLLFGNTLLLADGFSKVLDIDTKGWESRGVEEPKNEQVVRGPREGFTETIRFNTALLRRKIQNPNFMIEHMVIGERTHTTICLAYLKGVVNPKLIGEVKRRLERIETDAILESGYIEQYIEDAPLSPFSTIGNTEKPDVVAAKLLEGRITILVDGSPMALTVPNIFLEGFQSAEDYYSRPYFASFVRMIRFLAFFITLLAPAVYVALESFHQELIPTALLITMAAASEGTPFPAVVESLGMGIVFELLREGGIRLPGPVGSALSIVGALIIGDAAVSAGLVGAPMVIVVAITAVASFLVVAHTDAVTILRFILVILAGALGFFGIIIGLLAILIHLCSLRSFGVPYLSPLAPLIPKDLKDSVIRAPIWAMITRPRLISNLDPERQAFCLKPQPPDDI